MLKIIRQEDSTRIFLNGNELPNVIKYQLSQTEGDSPATLTIELEIPTEAEVEIW